MATIADDLAAEYRALTEGCGLLDRSERGKLALTGADAQVVPRRPGDERHRGPRRPARGCYAAFLTHKGKMLGDLRVLASTTAARTPELLLDTERATLQALFDMVRRFKIGYDVELHKRTVQRGLLSLIGPRARAVAGARADLPGRRARTPRRRDRRAAGAAHRHRRRRRRALRGRRHRAPCAQRCSRRPAPRRSPRPRPRSCASSAGARATASTSTTRRSPRRPGSTSAR